MANLTLAQPDLYSQSRAAEILGVERHTVREGVRALGLELKLRPACNGKLLDRDDIDRLASWLAKVVDWGDEPRS